MRSVNRSALRAVVLVSTFVLAACGTAEAPRDDGRLEVTVDGTGYHPAELVAPAGQAVQVVFTRTSEEGCGQEVVFPDLDLRRDLPLGTPVAIDVTMPATGRLAFTCGMAMYQGSIVAR